MARYLIVVLALLFLASISAAQTETPTTTPTTTPTITPTTTPTPTPTAHAYPYRPSYDWRWLGAAQTQKAFRQIAVDLDVVSSRVNLLIDAVGSPDIAKLGPVFYIQPTPTPTITPTMTPTRTPTKTPTPSPTPTS